MYIVQDQNVWTIDQYRLTTSSTSINVGLPGTETFVSGIARKCISVIVGLHCIEGETIQVLLDGNVEADYVVSDGKIICY